MPLSTQKLYHPKVADPEYPFAMWVYRQD